MRAKLLAGLLLILGWAGLAQAQGVHWVDHPVLNQAGQPVGGATITVCSPSAATNVFPCTPKTTIYSNLALTVVAPNPLTADARGNYDFYVTPGNYLITISGPSVQPYDEFLTLNSSGGGGANPGGVQGDVQINGGVDTLSPAAAHDTGSQFQITESSCNSGPRPWIDVTCPPYNAKGDGSTDDTAAISAAITASCATTTAFNNFPMHPAIFFPPGVYRVQQPQQPSVFPVFNLPTGCSFLEFLGMPGGSAVSFGNPAAQITVLNGASPNNAPIFQVNNGNESISFRNISIQGWNQAVYVNNTDHVTFDNAPMEAGITGQTDNTPLKVTNMLEVYRVNHSNCLFEGVATTLPPVIYTVESGVQPYLSFIVTKDVTDAGGAEQLIFRAQYTGGSAAAEFIFRDAQNEDSTNGWLTITNTSGTAAQGIGPFVMDRVTIEDGGGPIITLNDSTARLGQVYMNDVNYGLALAPVISILAGHMLSYNCFGPQCAVVDANGNATGQGRSNEMYGATDHVSDNSFEIAQATPGLFPTELLGIGAGPTLADRWCASGTLFCNIGIDPAFGVLFGLGDTNAFNAGLEQTVKESLDVQVAKVLPPTSPVGSATTGGALAAGTYYAQFYTTSNTTCDRTFSITSAPSYTAGVSVSGANNAIAYSWTLPVTTPLTPAGFCMEVQTSPIVVSSIINSAIFISGGSTTTFTYTGQSQTALIPVPAANQMTSIARFTSSALHVSGGVNSYSDSSGVANSIVVTTPLTLSGVQVGMSVNVKVANSNTGATTLNLNSLGAEQVTKQNGVALASGDLCANHEYTFVENGTSWDLVSPSCAAPISGVSSVSGDSGSIITNSSSTGAVTLVFGTESAHTVLAGPASGAAATPTFQTAPTIAVTNMTGTGAFNTTGNAGTATSAGTLTGCSEANAGDICYYTGSAWAVLTGNNSSTQYLQETSAGVPSWTVPSGAGTVTHSSGALTSGQPVLGNGSADVKVGPINLAGGSSFVTGALPNANLANSATTVNSQSCTLGSACTIPFLNNAGNQTSQAGLNLTTSTANAMGITITPVNTSGIIEKEEASGTVNTTSGGTGASAPTAHAVAIAEGASAFNFIIPGVSGTVLTSNGTSADPTYQATLVDPCTTLGCFIYGGAGGAATALNGPTSPNGVPQFILETPSGGAATAPTFGLAGVPVNNNGETTCASQTLNVLDRATAIFCTGTSTSTFTFPVHTTSGFGSAFPMLVVNNNSGKMTLTPTTDTIDNGSLYNGWADFLYNNASGNWQSVQFPQYALFPNTSAGTALTFNTSTGQFGTISVGGTLTFPLTVAGTTTSGGIPYFSNTTTLTSSALLPTGDFVLGGGAGGAPTASFSVVPVANGGTGTGSTLTGLVRGNASAMTAAEISGDCTTSGSNAITCTKINGTAVSGTNGDVTTFGAGNTLADSGFLGTTVARENTAITSGFIPKSNSSSVPTLAKSALDDGATTANTLTYTGTAGIVAPAFTSSGSTAGFLDLPQGSTSASTAPCNTANSICIQAPTSVTAQLRVLAGAPATGFSLFTNSSGTMTETLSAVDGTISTGPYTFGSSAVNTVVAQTIAVAAGHFTNLVETSSLGGSCTTAPTFNVFDGTSNTGTAQLATSTTQTKGTATSHTQTLTFAAGDLIGIYISTAGATCTADTWVVSAEYSIP